MDLAALYDMFKQNYPTLAENTVSYTRYNKTQNTILVKLLDGSRVIFTRANEATYLTHYDATTDSAMMSKVELYNPVIYDKED